MIKHISSGKYNNLSVTYSYDVAYEAMRGLHMQYLSSVYFVNQIVSVRGSYKEATLIIMAIACIIREHTIYTNIKFK